MEDNLSHLIEMIFATFMFVFALSNAVLSYTKVENLSENLISINIVNRRGTAVNTNLQEEDLNRETNYAEIALAALELQRTVDDSGMSMYSIEVNRKAATEGATAMTYTVEYRTEEMEDMSVPEEGEEGEEEVIAKYTLGYITVSTGASAMEYLVSAPAGIVIESDDFLSNAITFFGKNVKYNVSYTEDKIIYTEV